MAASPPRQLIIVAPGGDTTARLVAFADSMITDPERPLRMLALATAQRSVQRLRVVLRDETEVEEGVPTADVWRRAVSLLEQFPQAAGLSANWKSSAILSGHDRRFVIGRAWADVGGGANSLHARYGDAPGALDWLQRVFDRFAEWGGSADPARMAATPDDAALAELWGAYRAYLGLCRRYGLVAFQEVLPRAIDALRDTKVAARVQPDVLLLDGIDLFRSIDLLFAGALIGPHTAVAATTSRVSAVDDPDPQMRMLHHWCETSGLERVDTTTACATPVVPTLIAHATLDAEADTIARDVAMAIREGIPPDECAVVLFDGDLEAPVRRAFARHSVPLVGGERRDAWTLAIAPLATMALRLIAADRCSPAELLAFLRHPLIDLPAADLRACAATVDGSAGAHMLHDDDPLRVLLRLWPATSSPEGDARFRELVNVTQEAREAAIEPSVKLRGWLDTFGIGTRAAALTRRLLEPWAADADDAMLERWRGLLEQSERVHATLGTPLHDQAAVEVLLATQALVEPISRPVADAVQWWSPQHLSGWSARRVWLAGLNEQALPGAGETLPWAPWAAYEHAFGALPGFVRADPDDRAARWAHAQSVFERAIGRAADAVTLSWSTTGRDGRRRLRSPLLATMDAASSGVAVGAGLHSGQPISLVPTPQFPHPYVRTDALFTTSPSAIENYLRCPRQYFYARELQLFDVVSSSRQAFGQVVHASLREMEQSRDPTPDVVGLVDAHWSTTESAFGTRLRRAAFHDMAVDAVRQVAQFDRERSAAGVQFIAAETRFRWRIAPGVELRGTIDRIDRGPTGLSVLDYKLGADSPSINELLGMFVPPTEPEQRAAWRPSDLQLPLYALAIDQGALEDYPELAAEPVDEIGLIFPLRLYSPTGKASTTGRRMLKIHPHDEDCTTCTTPRGKSSATGTICRAQLDAVVNEALAVVGAMQSGIIDPAPVDGATTCRMCAFRVICPAPQG